MSNRDEMEGMEQPELNVDPHDPEFEHALTRSLRHVDAPDDLMSRVMAQVEAEQRTAAVQGSGNRDQGTAGWWRSLAESWSFGWKPAWGAMAAMLVASVLTGHVVHEHRVEQQERARVQASRQFDVSVQITDQALDHAREQLRKAGVPLDEDER